MKVGQKVVCVKDGFDTTAKQWQPNRPIKGEIYTIRDMRYFVGFGNGIWLVELVNPMIMTVFGVMEPGFDADAFRPVDESFGEEIAEKLEKDFKPEREPVLVRFIDALADAVDRGLNKLGLL